MSEWSESTNRAPIVVAASLLALILGVGIVGARSDGGNDAAATGTLPVASGSVVPEPIVSVLAVVASESTSPTVTLPAVSRSLQQGAQGDDVQMVQQRLADLGFDPGPVDGIFGTLTTQAVWAFEKLVLGTPRTDATGVVSPERWDRLRGDVNIAPRRSTNGQANHTEVYLPEQVLIVFHRDRPVLISHMSSGEVDENGDPREYCETATYDTDAQGRELDEPETKQVCALAKTPGGIFTYDRQVEGKRVSPLGGMWNPVYFNYGIAVHGAENVPNEPASHGCVRLPMHISNYFQGLVSIGDRILVWNGQQEPEDVSDRESLPSFDYADPDATTTTTSTTTTTTTTTTTVAPATTARPATTTAPQTTATPKPSTTVRPSTSVARTTTTAPPATDTP